MLLRRRRSDSHCGWCDLAGTEVFPL